MAFPPGYSTKLSHDDKDRYENWMSVDVIKFIHPINYLIEKAQEEGVEENLKTI